MPVPAQLAPLPLSRCPLCGYAWRQRTAVEVTAENPVAGVRYVEVECNRPRGGRHTVRFTVREREEG